MKIYILKNCNIFWNFIEFILIWKNFFDSYCFVFLGIEKLFVDFLIKMNNYSIFCINCFLIICILLCVIFILIDIYIYLYLEYIDKNFKGLVWLIYISCLIYVGVLYV